jgi:thioredoxin 1
MKKTLITMLSMLVLMLTPVSLHYANNEPDVEYENSQTMMFIDAMFKKLVTMDSTMLEAQKKWDTAKKQDDVVELCLAWDNVIEGEKFQVLKQETIHLLRNANQKIDASKFIKSIKRRTVMVSEIIDGEHIAWGCHETSDYIDRLEDISENNAEDAYKIIFNVMGKYKKLKGNEALQAYINLVKAETTALTTFLNQMENSCPEHLTPMDFVHARLKSISKLIQSDEFKNLKHDPEVVTLSQELINEILSHENLVASMVDFLIDVETDLFDLVDELLTLNINPFGNTLYDFWKDENTQVAIDLHFNDNVVWHYGCPQGPLMKDFGLLEPMMESKTFKSIGLLSDIMDSLYSQHVNTPQYTFESSQIDRLVDNHYHLLNRLQEKLIEKHDQFLENFQKHIEKKWVPIWNHEIDEQSELESDSAVIMLENLNDYDQIVSNSDLVLVDFYADWCGPCNMLKPHLETLSNSNQNITVLTVDVDDFYDLASGENVRCMPTLVLFENGVEVARHEGCLSYDELLEFVG